jgi:hypothetical protein
MGMLSWFAELGRELTDAGYNDARDLANAGGNWRNLRDDQKLNILTRAGFPIKDLTDDDDLDSILGMFL